MSSTRRWRTSTSSNGVACLRRMAASDCRQHDRRSFKTRDKEITGQDDLSELPDRSARPRLEEADECARLFDLVDQLPADQRRVIGMRFAEEKSIREIAQALGRSEGAVKQFSSAPCKTCAPAWRVPMPKRSLPNNKMPNRIHRIDQLDQAVTQLLGRAGRQVSFRRSRTDAAAARRRRVAPASARRFQGTT